MKKTDLNIKTNKMDEAKREVLRIHELFKQKHVDFENEALQLISSGIHSEFLYTALMEYYVEREQYEKAIHFITECRKHFPNNTNHNINQSVVLNKLKLFDPSHPKSKTIHAVVSRFEENVDYLQNYPFEYTLYNKGSAINEKSIQLPNVGKCDHTYLTFIVDNYSSLPEITLFLPASFYKNPLKRILTDELIYRLLVDGKTSFVGRHLNDLVKNNYSFELEKWDTTATENKGACSTNLEPCSERPYGKWVEKIFGEVPAYPFITFFALLAVRKKDILARPRSFYETLLEYVKTPNPEAGHYIERSWGLIFPCSDPEFIAY